MNLRAKALPYLKPVAILALVITLAFSTIILRKETPVQGLSGSDFVAGRIIDDSVFTNKNAMSVGEIQNFLEDMVDDSDQIPDGVNGSCDNDGSEPYAGTTKAQYAANHPNGNSTPFTCLYEYYENTSTHANNYGESSTPSGAKSAARIIWDAAQQYDINPQVLLVTLQKEQSLLTDDWAWKIQYRTAMGYGCPDTADCDADYYGFFNQVDSAAWQFRQYLNNPQNYNHDIGSNYIRWSPISSCGGSTVNIQNLATAALYNYTPYRPNSAALNNLYGSGNSCSSYGNRNFWRYFNDWFGSTYGTINVSRNLQYSPVNPLVGDQVAASFIISNNEQEAITINRMTVAARNSKGQNRNFPTLNNITIQPGESYEYYQSRSFSDPGDYKIWIAIYKSGVWEKDWPKSLSPKILRERTISVRQPNIQVTRGIKHSPANAIAGQQKAVSFVIKNNDSVPVTIARLVAAVRDGDGNSANFPTINDISLNPGEEYEYYQYNTFTNPGKHTVWIAAYTAAGEWSRSWPAKVTSSILTERTFGIRQPNIQVTRGIKHSPANAIAGQQKAVSFVIKNNDSVPVTIARLVAAVRDGDGNSANFPTINDISLNPGEEYEYYQYNTFTNPGKHTVWIAAYTAAGEWSRSWPAKVTSSILTERTFEVIQP